MIVIIIIICFQKRSIPKLQLLFNTIIKIISIIYYLCIIYYLNTIYKMCSIFTKCTFNVQIDYLLWQQQIITQ